MPGTVTFPINDRVKGLYEHAKAATKHRPLAHHFEEPEYRLLGHEEPDYAGLDDIDLSKIPGGLHLVNGADGIFLASSGEPALMDESGQRLLLQQSLETDHALNPDWYHTGRAIAGGDDGSELIELDYMERVFAHGARALEVVFGDNSLEYRAIL